MNKVIELGRITHDLELKQTTSGKSVIIFSIAVPRDYTNDNGDREADFFEINAWGSKAEFIARNFTKGKMIAIVGRLKTQKWKDQNGNNRYKTFVEAEDIYFCGDGKKEPAQEYTPPEAPYPPNFAPFNYNDEDLPY